jgi:hypothetical protein
MPGQLHQSALWAAHIREHHDGWSSCQEDPFYGSPDQGDSCMMQGEMAGVNEYVVIF